MKPSGKKRGREKLLTRLQTLALNHPLHQTGLFMEGDSIAENVLEALIAEGLDSFESVN